MEPRGAGRTSPWAHLSSISDQPCSTDERDEGCLGHLCGQGVRREGDRRRNESGAVGADGRVSVETTSLAYPRPAPRAEPQHGPPRRRAAWFAAFGASVYCLILWLVYRAMLPGEVHNGYARDPEDVIDAEGKRSGRRHRKGASCRRSPRRRSGDAVCPRVKVIPPAIVIAGRRGRWKSGSRGFGGRLRRNPAMRLRRWTVIKGGACPADSTRRRRRACSNPDDQCSAPACPHGVERHGRGEEDGGGGVRHLEGHGRRVGRAAPPRRRLGLMRLVMSAAMLFVTKGTSGPMGGGGETGSQGSNVRAMRDAFSVFDGSGGTQAEDVVAWTATPDLPTVAKYPSPRQQGFHGARTAGHGRQGEDPQGDHLRLRATTVNSTGWGPLRSFLAKTEAHIIFNQEHRLPAHDIPAASAWARRNGWKSVWAPAVKGPKGGWSAGTAILVRSFIGLRHPDVGGRVPAEARAVAAIIEAPSFRPFMAYSAYCHHGQGLSRANLGLCAAIGRHWEMQEDPALQYVCAADWNMEPVLLQRAGLDEAMNGKVVCTTGLRGTCRTRTKASRYDYFLMSCPMAEAVEAVQSVEASGIRTHTPVELIFLPRPTSLRALSIRLPPSLPVDRVYGPLPAPPSEWASLQETADILCDAARNGAERGAVEAALADLYALWLDVAEQELMDITGTPVKKEGLRGKGPRFIWKSVLPEKRGTDHGGSASAALAWLEDLLRDLSRVSAKSEAACDRLGLATQLLVALRADMPRNCAATISEGDVSKVEDLIRGAIDFIKRDADYLTDDGHGDHDARDERAGDEHDADDVRGDGPADGDRLGDEVRDGPWAQWRCRLDELADDVHARLTTSTAVDAQAKAEKWREWIREGFEAGARHAHAFSRLPAEWVPTSVVKPNGTRSAEPTAILEAQRAKYAGMWAAGDEPGGYRWQSRQALPRLGPDELRAASKLFRARTAVAYDGIHMRHYASMCNGALATLGTILEICELMGAMPRQCGLVTAPLLEKPKGGYRPICIYSSLYRLWAKARQPVAAKWEAEFPRPFLSAAAGNGPGDTTWRQAVRQEASVSQGGAAATLLWDLDGFFERVDRERLMRRASQTGFPLPVLRLSLAMYAAPRVLTLDGRLARELWARDGVGAGCGLACTYVKIYAVPPLDKLVPRLPPTVTLDLHVDDFALSCEAPTAEQVVRDLTTAQALLKELIEAELGAKVSMPKAALVASSLELATMLRDSIGELAGPLRRAAPNLGVDAMAGKRRGTRATGLLRRQRMMKAWKRRGRLQQLVKVLGSGASRIYTAGVGPSATYHAAVQGLTDKEMLLLRRLAATTFPPRSRFRSLTAAHVINGMPTAAAEVAAAVQYSRMVWAATVCGAERPRYEGFGLPGLRSAWEEVRRRADTFLNADASDDSRRRCWDDTRGPLAAAMLELDRVGWVPEGPFEWKDDLGVRVCLTETPPSMLKDLLTAAVKRKAERIIGAERARTDPAFNGKRACLDVAMSSAMRSRSMTPLEKGAFRSVITGAVLTMSRARANGYEVEDLCPLCGECGDTVHHRVYGCCKSRDVVRASVPKWFWDEAQRASHGDRFWTTGVMPHPAELVPPARDDYLPWVIDANGERGDDPSLSGHVFIDGSCKVSTLPGLQRASVAMVQMDENARRVKTVSLPLWCTLPQTAQASEYAAYSAVAQLLVGDTVIYGDCKGVLDAAAAPVSRQLDGRRKYAGVLLAAHRDPTSLRRIKSLVKVKAHQDIDAIQDPDEKWRARGNEMADEAAKLARDRHPQPSKEQQAALDFYVRRIPHIVKAVGKAMALFPPAGGSLPRRTPTRTKKGNGSGADGGLQRHQWRHVEGRWRCSRCWTYVLGTDIPASRKLQGCNRTRVTNDLRRFEALGHDMLHADGDLPIVYCGRCGAWSSRRAQSLAKPCGPPTANGRLALRRISLGLHPWRARGGGAEGDRPRGRLTAVSRTGPSEEGGGGEGGEDQSMPADDLPADDHDHAIPVMYEMHEDFPEEFDVFGHGGALDDEADRDRDQGGRLRDADEQGGRGHEQDGSSGRNEPIQVLVDEDGRDPRLYGTSLGMVATAVGDAETAMRKGKRMQHGEGRWAVFNQRTGAFVVTTIAALAKEQAFLIREFNEEALAGSPSSKRMRMSDRGDDSDANGPMVAGGEGSIPVESRGGACVAREGDPRGGTHAVSENSPRDATPRTGASVPRPGDDASDSVNATFSSREELRRYLKRAAPSGPGGGSTPGGGQCKGGGDVEGRDSEVATRRVRARGTCERVDGNKAGAKSTALRTIGASEGLGGSRDACSTAAAALSPRAKVAAAVAAERGAALLQRQTILAASPPSGCAAPLDGDEDAVTMRPVSTSPLAWSRSLSAGLSYEGHEGKPHEGEGPTRGEARRMGGADVASPRAAVARCGADATAPGGATAKPQRGSNHCILGARIECTDRPRSGSNGRVLDTRPEDDMMTESCVVLGSVAGGLLLPPPHDGRAGPRGFPRRDDPQGQGFPLEGLARRDHVPRRAADQGLRLPAADGPARAGAALDAGLGAADDSIGDGRLVFEQPGDDLAISPSALGMCTVSAAAAPGSGRAAGRVISAAALPASEPSRDGCADYRQHGEAAGGPTGAGDRGGGDGRSAGLRPPFGHGDVFADGRATEVGLAPVRRRVTGKRKSTDCMAQGPGGGVAGCANSAPAGGGMHDDDAEAEIEDGAVPEGARRQRTIKGFKRTRPAEKCDASQRIGREAHHPARACGEKNSLKSTCDLREGLAAADGTAEGAHIAAAAALTSPPTSAEV